MKKRSTLGLALLVTLVAGCSSISQEEFDALKVQVSNNEQTAQEALQTAKQANVNAQDAKATATRTEEKLNRVFRKSQMK